MKLNWHVLSLALLILNSIPHTAHAKISSQEKLRLKASICTSMMQKWPTFLPSCLNGDFRFEEWPPIKGLTQSANAKSFKNIHFQYEGAMRCWGVARQLDRNNKLEWAPAIEKCK